MKWLLPPILWVFCIALIVALSVWAPVATILPDPFPHAGWVLVLSGIGLGLAGSGRFRKVGTNIHTFRDPDILVTDGVFARTRNPMYLGFVLTLLGGALIANAISAFAPVILFLLAANFWYIPYEERAAAARFGDAYADYRRRVRRWL